VAACTLIAACNPQATPSGGSGGAAPTATTANGTSQNVQEVTIIAKDNAFDPGTYTVEAGRPIRLTVTNSGQNVHEVEVKGLLSETQLAPGQSKTVELQPPAPGTYRIYCEIHEDQGMEGEFVVK
jgi:plastocyanin